MITFRYGEVRSAAFTVIVAPHPMNDTNKTSTLPFFYPTTSTLNLKTISSSATDDVTEITPTDSGNGSTTFYPITWTEMTDTEQEEYQRQFFLLKVLPFVNQPLNFTYPEKYPLFNEYEVPYEVLLLFHMDGDH